MFNDINRHSIKYADDWAQRTGAKLYFLHALNLSDRFYSDMIENVFESRNPEVLEDLGKKLESFLSELDVKSDYECILKVGKPYFEIIEQQKAINADLIVMASHSHSLMERKILGKNTDHVLHSANCSVYVYKEHTRTFSNKIIVPLGNISPYRVTEIDNSIIKMADEWALRRGSELYFVHATRLTERFYVPDIEQIYESKMGTEQTYNSLRKNLSEFVSSFDIKSPYECIIRDGKPTHKIIDQQEALNAKLVIMSAHGQTPLERFMLGSTTDYVLHHSHCPIYVHKS